MTGKGLATAIAEIFIPLPVGRQRTMTTNQQQNREVDMRTLTEQQLALCRVFGNTPEEFLIAKNAEQKDKFENMTIPEQREAEIMDTMGMTRDEAERAKKRSEKYLAAVKELDFVEIEISVKLGVNPRVYWRDRVKQAGFDPDAEEQRISAEKRLSVEDYWTEVQRVAGIVSA